MTIYRITEDVHHGGFRCTTTSEAESLAEAVETALSRSPYRPPREGGHFESASAYICAHLETGMATATAEWGWATYTLEEIEPERERKVREVTFVVDTDATDSEWELLVMHASIQFEDPYNSDGYRADCEVWDVRAEGLS